MPLFLPSPPLHPSLASILKFLDLQKPTDVQEFQVVQHPRNDVNSV